MIIDIFNHFMPKAYFDRLGDFIPGHPVLAAFPRLQPLVDVEARLRLIDEFGEMQHVISLANPPLELIAGPDRTPELARLANDALAEVCRKHPKRFPAFIASLPMNNVEASLAEADRAIQQLGARGVQMFTNVAGKPLSVPEYPSTVRAHGGARPAGLGAPDAGGAIFRLRHREGIAERDLVQLRLAV